MKPVFIPLKTKNYEAFESGKKHSEFRIYGPRWDEKTCIPDAPLFFQRGMAKQIVCMASSVHSRSVTPTHSAPRIKRR
jgi:hypothetical protein